VTVPPRLAPLFASVGVLLAALTVAASTAFAQQRTQGLAFRDSRMLTLDWSEARKGEAVRLCNTDAQRATNVDASLTGFDFLENEKPKADGDVVIVTLAGSELDPGECRDVVIARKREAKVDPGTYTGILVVTAAGAGVARRGVTIDGPGTLPQAPVGAASELNATRHGWGDEAQLNEDDRALPLQPPTGNADLDVPKDCPAAAQEDSTGSAAASSDRRTKCAFVGNLYNGTDAAQVYVDGPLRMDANGPALLPLRLAGADKIGSYQGALNLAGTPATDDDVAVKAEVTESIWWAIGALLVGAALSLGSQYVLRRFMPKHHLRDRWRNFQANYVKAKRDFDSHAPEHSGFTTPESAGIAAYATAIDEGIKRYGRSTVWFDPESDAYREIDASLDQVEDDIRCWRMQDGLASSVKALRTALTEIEQFLNKEFPVPSAPRFVARAASLLKPRQLKVGEAKELAAQAAKYTALAHSWIDLGREANRYDAWWRMLSQVADRMSESDRARVALAARKVAEAENEMLDASDAADLGRLGAVADLREAYQNLAFVGARYGWLPPPETDPAEVAADFGVLGLDAQDTRLSMLTFARGALRYGFDRLLAEADEPDVAPAQAAALSNSLKWIGGTFVLAFTVIAGIVAGLVAFYFDEPWGTTEDYLTVIFVGAAAQVLTQGVADTVGKLLPPAPDQLVGGPAAAAIDESRATAGPAASPAVG
jgi:hypothetical protein